MRNECERIRSIEKSDCSDNELKLQKKIEQNQLVLLKLEHRVLNPLLQMLIIYHLLSKK